MDIIDSQSLRKRAGMSDYYNNEYHRARHADIMSDDEYFWARSEASARFYFSERERDNRIFEYGCGIGQGIAALPNAKGWDISAEALQSCRNRGIHVYDSLDQVPTGAWDIVFCRHVLEHIETPLFALRKMRELLADDGELYLILPKERHYEFRIKTDINQHLYCWNFRTINNLLFRAGFVPYLNNYKYVLGYRRLLLLRRLFGRRIYLAAAIAIGHLLRNGELIVRARLAGHKQ